MSIKIWDDFQNRQDSSIPTWVHELSGFLSGLLPVPFQMYTTLHIVLTYTLHLPTTPGSPQRCLALLRTGLSPQLCLVGPGDSSLTLVMEEAIEFLHDCRLHDLSEEGVLLSQLLGTEVLPMARRPLVVVEQVDEGCVGRLGEQLLVDIREEPGEVEGAP